MNRHVLPHIGSRLLPLGCAADPVFADRWPAWSPDGTKIALAVCLRSCASRGPLGPRL
jgi:hypothetical protein